MIHLSDYFSETQSLFVGQYSWLPDPKFGTDEGAFRVWRDTGERWPSGMRKSATEQAKNPAPAGLQDTFWGLRTKYTDGILVRWAMSSVGEWETEGYDFPHLDVAEYRPHQFNESGSHYFDVPEEEARQLIGQA